MPSPRLLPSPTRSLVRAGLAAIPGLFAEAGEPAARRFMEFFTANIRNRNTRRAYAQAVSAFADWCERRGVRQLARVQPLVVSAYVEELSHQRAAPTVKQHLAAIRMLFDWLVVGQVVPVNPAHAVRGPKHVVKKGKTPVLSVDETRLLLNTIAGMELARFRGPEHGALLREALAARRIADLRDLALVGVLTYSFARIGAVLGTDVDDYFDQRGRKWFRLHEKGGKHHEVPAHWKARAFTDAYLEAAGSANEKTMPLFRSLNRHRRLTDRRLEPREALAMLKRRTKQAGLSSTVCCHTFRATGITAYLDSGGSLEHAQRIAAHESPRTTKLYDRTGDAVSMEEIDRIGI